MKTEKNILVAFFLNISFSIIELIGGIFTNSVAIMSDSLHDFGDALSIGISYFLERKSNKKPDSNYTYGYIRYSTLGALITTIILIIGSLIVMYSSIKRIINPVEVNYNGMIVIAVFGVIINFFAAYFTKDGESLNQKSVNLHMLEDVLGWVVVLIGSVLIKFTEINMLDSIMSIGVATFILINSLKNLKSILDLFLEKTPKNISIDEIKNNLLKIKGIKNVHHIHIWSIDGENNYATIHVVIAQDKDEKIKQKIREELLEHKVVHVTIEIETENELCDNEICSCIANTTAHHKHNH